MRLMLIVVTVAVAMLLDLRVSQATQMPWCAGTSKGDFFSYNCSLPTYEMCVQEVIAGNRGSQLAATGAHRTGQSHEETPSNSSFLAALHSGLEQAKMVL